MVSKNFLIFISPRAKLEINKRIVRVRLYGNQFRLSANMAESLKQAINITIGQCHGRKSKEVFKKQCVKFRYRTCVEQFLLSVVKSTDLVHK